MSNISSFQSSSRTGGTPVPPHGTPVPPGGPPMPPDGPLCEPPSAAVTKAASAQLLEQLSQGALGPITKLQEALDLTIGQIADWMAHPRNRHVVANLVNLFDAQTQLMVCQHRLIAVARLAEVAATAQSPETVRRACKDMLSVRLINPYLEDERPEKPPPPREVDTEEILEALERLGGADGWEPEEYVPPMKSGGPPEREVEDRWNEYDRARASMTDERGAASGPSKSEDSAAGKERSAGAPRRAQTNPCGGSCGARAGLRGDQTREDARSNLNVRAPPRATVRRY